MKIVFDFCNRIISRLATAQQHAAQKEKDFERYKLRILFNLLILIRYSRCGDPANHRLYLDLSCDVIMRLIELMRERREPLMCFFRTITSQSKSNLTFLINEIVASCNTGKWGMPGEIDILWDKFEVREYE